MIRDKRIVMLGVLVGLLLSGCSEGEKKSYTVPEKLCGAAVAPDLTSALLPAGDKLRVTQSSSGGPATHEFCDVLVDGNIELAIKGVWRPSGTTAKQAADKELVFNSRSTDGGRFALSDDKAFTVVDCKNTEHKAERFSFEVTVAHPTGDISQKMQRFLAAFSEAYHTTLPCQS
ncbi:hypothetical protein GCM10014715_76260 [Streptomyces spiralis]|uniref:Lipoprotein n=1 Tax=Streptomyces spiralis TaxID=66376 RepID=A0A919AHY3_9ACTN|nr:hypothetical protein [Streptomyces spiralis]GHF09141.1 hypothetical protein GCM10014715_76260 [Streptomyces spiralis]